MTEEEKPVDVLQEARDRKRKAQHEAWRRWYRSDKGEAYRAKYKQRAKELRVLREAK